MRFVLSVVVGLILPLPSLTAQQPRDTLSSFTSDAEFVTYYRSVLEERERARRAADSAYRHRMEASERCRQHALDLKVATGTGGAPKTAVIGGQVLTAASMALAGGRVVRSPHQRGTLRRHAGRL